VEWAREYVRDIRLTRSVEHAAELCDRALSELFRTRPSLPRQPGEFEAWTRLHDAPAARNRLRFTLRPEGDSTVVSVSSRKAAGMWLAVMMPATLRERRAQVDELADWLVEAGPGEHRGRRTGEIVWR
jgi:hypothetical protein